MHKNYPTISIERRLFAVIMLIVVAFFMLFGRLFFVQLIMGNKYSIMALDQWTRDLNLEAPRGIIYDRNKVELAVSYTNYNVYVRPSAIKNAGEVASVLSNVCNVTYDKAFKLASTKGVSEALVCMQISKEDMLKIKKSNLDGIYFSETNKRFYPYDNLLTQVLGYNTIDNFGQAGLEAYYDKYLKGIDGKILTEGDITGRELKSNVVEYLPYISGNNLVTTIDLNLQLILENTLDKVMVEQKAKGATGILMNAKTGEVLAMSNKPSFSLNNVPRDDITTMMEQTKNKSIVDVYEPGSTFKILTVASAIEENLTNFDDAFYDPGYRMIDGQKIKCWKTIGHGHQNLMDGFANSCNSVFMDLALRLGKDKFYNYLNKFGVNNKTGIDFLGESSGILMPKGEVKNVDLARIGFGHAVAVTMIGLLSSVCTAVNGGYKITPTFVKEIISPNNQVLNLVNNGKVKVISEATSKKVCELMSHAVNKKEINSFVPGYDIGGKTGTAQKYENGVIAQGKYVSSFIGIYPSYEPEYVLMIAVDEPGTGIYYGSLVAAPYGKEYFSQMFNYLNIAPINLEKDLKLMEKVVQIPNLVGKSLTDAINIIIERGLQYEIQGEGLHVVGQVKAPNEMTFKNDIVLLIT